MLTSALTRIESPGPTSSGVPVLAYVLDGVFDAADTTRLREDLDAHDRVRMLIRIDALSLPSLSTFTNGFLSMKVDAFRKVERYAIVGGPDWIRAYVGAVGGLAPFAMKHFEDEAAAWAWIQSPATGDEIEEREEAAEKAAPAVTRLPSHRPDLVAFHLDGHLTARDYETVVDPAIEAATRDHAAIDLLVRFGSLDGVSLGALKDDAALTKYTRSIRRMALVGAPHWLGTLAEGAGALTPIEIETFDDEAPARAWLGRTA